MHHPEATFGDAVRRRAGLSRSDPDIFMDVEWAFPAQSGSGLADQEGMICSLAFGRRGIKAGSDEELRGFSGDLYTVYIDLRCNALKPAPSKPR